MLFNVTLKEGGSEEELQKAKKQAMNEGQNQICIQNHQGLCSTRMTVLPF